MANPLPNAQQSSMIDDFVAEFAPTPDDIAGVGGSDLGGKAGGALPRNYETIMRIPVSVKIVLGSATMPVSALMKLGRGSVIPLDRHVGEPVDVTVNGRVVARGEVVVLNEGPSRFGISLTEVVGPGGGDKAA